VKGSVEKINLRQYQNQEDNDKKAAQNEDRQRLGIPLRHLGKVGFWPRRSNGTKVPYVNFPQPNSTVPQKFLRPPISSNPAPADDRVAVIKYRSLSGGNGPLRLIKCDQDLIVAGGLNRSRRAFMTMANLYRH
jgi:hypothetical protein